MCVTRYAVLPTENPILESFHLRVKTLSLIPDYLSIKVANRKAYHDFITT